MNQFEYRIAAYFDKVIPSPTIYKNRTYKTREACIKDWDAAVYQYTNNVSYKKHIKRVVMQVRPVGEWEDTII